MTNFDDFLKGAVCDGENWLDVGVDLAHVIR